MAKTCLYAISRKKIASSIGTKIAKISCNPSAKTVSECINRSIGQPLSWVVHDSMIMTTIAQQTAPTTSRQDGWKNWFVTIRIVTIAILHYSLEPELIGKHIRMDCRSTEWTRSRISSQIACSVVIALCVELLLDAGVSQERGTTGLPDASKRFKCARNAGSNAVVR